MNTTITTLNQDVMNLIFSNLKYIQTCELGVTCKTFAAMLKKYHRKNTRYLADIKLKPMQALLAKEFLGKSKDEMELEMEERGETSFRIDYGETPGYCCMSFRAQMGFGKTIAGYACCRGFTLIVATNNTAKIWSEEAKKLGWYSADPKKSKVLFYSSKYPKHFTYLKSLISSPTLISHDDAINMIIVTFDKNAHDVVTIGNSVHVEDATLIIDEAHIERKEICSLQSYCKWNGGYIFDRELLLSASSMNESRIGFSCGSIHRKVRISAMEDCPTVIWAIRPDVYSNSKLKSSIEKIVNNHYKTVIVITNSLIEELLNVENTKKTDNVFDIEDTKVFHLKTGTTTVTRFNSYNGAALLFINTNQNEGLTVEADAMIIISPESMNINRCVQTVGRIIRPCNLYEEATIYMLCAEDHDIRCSYVRYFFDERFSWNYETAPKYEYLVKCNNIAKLLGSNHSSLSSVDGCIIFHDYSKIKIEADALIEWWNRYKEKDTVLNEKIIRDLANVR